MVSQQAEHCDVERCGDKASERGNDESKEEERSNVNYLTGSFQ